MKKLPLLILTLLIAAVIPASLCAQNPVNVVFHNFAWGTSMRDFTARMGTPVHTEEINGFRSLLYTNVPMAGYRTFMVAYFSQNGLEGAYYFNTNDTEEMMRCYTAVQTELVAQFGRTPPPPAGRYEELLREMRVYETCWNLPNGYVHLKVNTRRSDPVTLWISFPALTEMLDGS